MVGLVVRLRNAQNRIVLRDLLNELFARLTGRDEVPAVIVDCLGDDA